MFLKKVRKNIEQLNMITPEDVVLVGVSGGADSVCLLFVLHELQKELGFTLEVVHVEHGIRGEESKSDEKFVKNLAEQLAVDCHVVCVDVPAYANEKGLGLEETARMLRYEAFERIALSKNTKIKVALAHHMEDNAETILFQLARGSSLTGLCGMQPIREGDAVAYIRPLLSCSRKEIETYLEARNQPYCVDSTNKELDYSRNYLRNVIIPEFGQINQKSVQHIHETAQQLREIRSFLDEEVLRYWNEIVTEEDGFQLDIKRLEELHPALQKEIVYQAIGRMAGGRKDISAVHVMQVLELMKLQSGREYSLPKNIKAKRENQTIRLFFQQQENDIVDKEAEKIEVSAEMLEMVLKQKEGISIQQNGKELMKISVIESGLDTEEIPQKIYTKWFDYDKIKDGFCIRKRQSGDYLICDAFGHKKKLKQYFVDEKIPATKREKIWLIAKEHQVLWVIGGRMSEHGKVTRDTKTIIEITFKEESYNEL